MKAAPPVLAIIGGGFAGTTLALQARRAQPETAILLFEPGTPGPGLAYSTEDPGHVLNVPAGSMSLFPDSPAHFAEWLAAQPDAPAPPAAGPAFAPRPLFGRYLREAFQAAGGPMLRHVPEAVLAVEREAGGGFRLSTAAGIYHADRVALTIGGFAAGGANGSVPSPVHDNPWDPAALRDVPPEAPVLLVGLGLTAVDMLVSLRGQGHRGPVLAISRHGWLPTSHVEGPFPPAWKLDLGSASGPLPALRLLRTALAEAARQGVPWQAVLDGVRPQTQSLWLRWGPAAQRQFLRHARSLWNLHRHRVAPRIGRFLAEEIEGGRFSVLAGRLESWRAIGEGATGKRVEALIRRRDGRAEPHPVERIILCTGPDNALTWRRAPPMPSLLEGGLVLRDTLGLGLRSGQAGEVRDDQGKTVPGFAVIGPLARGTLWEVTAVPEIRAQAASALAGELSIMPPEE